MSDLAKLFDKHLGLKVSHEEAIAIVDEMLTDSIITEGIGDETDNELFIEGVCGWALASLEHFRERINPDDIHR